MDIVTHWYQTMALLTTPMISRNTARREPSDTDIVTKLHPQANAMAERMVKMIHAAVLEDKDPRREVYIMAMTHNNTPHSVTGKAPSDILMGRNQTTCQPSQPNPTRTTRQSERGTGHQKKRTRNNSTRGRGPRTRPKDK